MKERILVVDDEFVICDSIRDSLDSDYLVDIASSGEGAISIATEKQPDLILLDLYLPGMSGVDVLRQIKQKCPEAIVIIVSAADSTNLAVDCMKSGALDYIVKPFDRDELKLCVERALEDKRLREENLSLKETVKSQFLFEDIIGDSQPLKKVCQLVHRSAQTNSTVLITGETGTGKELVSKTIHLNSSRKDGPFRAINCAGIPKDLLESELFGYEKGAFTGATKTKKGLFEVADGGSLLLDEISELPQVLQAKLLRILEERILTRIGGTDEITIDIRVICATNTDLNELVKRGRFREDLFYRINVFPIHIPALRERKEDIPLLVEFFLNQFEEAFGEQTISPEAVSILTKYDWPGNVREVKNVIERILNSSRNKKMYTLTIEDIPKEIFNIDAAGPEKGTFAGKMLLEEAVSDTERKVISNALKQSNKNITKAAQVLGTSYRILKYKMDKLGIK